MQVDATLRHAHCLYISSQLLRCRQVSHKWLALAARPELWRSHALALTESDPVQLTPPKDALEWENLVKGLYFRERNWANGIAQRVELMQGHTGFVTAMKLKGKNTLVTGSYDETIRVWEVSRCAMCYDWTCLSLPCYSSSPAASAKRSSRPRPSRASTFCPKRACWQLACTTPGASWCGTCVRGS